MMRQCGIDKETQGRSERLWEDWQYCKKIAVRDAATLSGSGDVVKGVGTSSRGRERRQGGGNVVKGAGTSSRGREHRQGGGDVTVTSGTATIS